MINVTASRNNDNFSDFQCVVNNADLEIHNSILYDNMTSVVAGNNLNGTFIDYSLVQGVTVTGINNNLGGVTPATAVNPMFVNPVTGNYQLSMSSQCINAGNNSYLGQKLWGLDLKNNPRLYASNVDMGAYEHNPFLLPDPADDLNPFWKSADNEQDEELTQDIAAWTVYPNPTNSQLRIKNYELREAADIQIYDVVGKLLQSKIVNLQSEIILDVSHLANGMYYLKIDGKTVKFVKE
jgi:hypothetical protein